MPGIKIINVLRDDTLAEILEIFRQAPVGEVIFVLPKNGKLFRKEDHFSAFASEAANGGKTISILSSNPATASLARKYKFNVMSAGKGKEEPEPQVPATLASSPPPADDDVRDDEDSAPDADSRVVGTSDETMGTVAEEAEEEKMEGFHVEDAEGPVDVDADGDGNADEPKAKDVEYGDADLTNLPVPHAPARATLAASVDGVRVTRAKKSVPQPKKAARADNIDIPITRERQETVEEIEEILEQPAAPVAAAPRSAVSADLDYIDAVWRQKAAANVAPVDSPGPIVSAGRPWKSYFRIPPFWFPTFSTFLKGGSVGTSKRMVSGALALSVVLLGAAIYLTAGSATVSINPTTRPLDIQLTVQASDVFSAVDPEFNKIPGQLFEVSKTATAKQDATGTRDVASKARVRLTVHNEYSSTPQTLVATTRFATPDGLVFRTLQSVTVPGSTVSEGKPVAGTVQVDVIADKPGPQYNIAAGRWTIVAFQEKGDTDRAAKIYGVSTEVSSGGASGPSKVVTQADYDKARAEAVASVKEQIAIAFGEQQSGLRILDEAEPALGDVTATARPDDAADSVTVTAKGTLRTVAFRQEDLDKLIVDSVLSQERLVVVPSQLTLAFSDVAFKSDTGVLSFSVSLKGNGYEPVDVNVVRADIKGMNGQQIRDYFSDREGVESATVSLRPFWVRKVPTKDSRIEVTVNYGEPAAVPQEN